MQNRSSFAFVLVLLIALAGISFSRDIFLHSAPDALTAQAAAASPPPPTASTQDDPTGTKKSACPAGSVDVVDESSGGQPTIAISSCYQTTALVPSVPGQPLPDTPTAASGQQTKINSTICQNAQPDKCVVEACSANGSCTKVAACAPGDTACLNSGIQQASGASVSPLSNVSVLSIEQAETPPAIQPTQPSNVLPAISQSAAPSANPSAAASVPSAPVLSVLSGGEQSYLDLNTETAENVTGLSPELAQTQTAPASTPPPATANTTFSPAPDTVIKDTTINFMSNATAGALNSAASTGMTPVPSTNPFVIASQPGGFMGSSNLKPIPMVPRFAQ